MADRLRDYLAGETVRYQFYTAGPTGLPVTLDGTPAAVVYQNGVASPSVAGVALSVDYDGRTGLHQVSIDTSADAGFYAAGDEFLVVLTAGTVNGVVVAPRALAQFRVAATVLPPALSVGDAVYLQFGTNGMTGLPATLGGTPEVVIYRSAADPTLSDDGVSLTVDYDGRTGLHEVAVDTSADTGFYVPGDFMAVLSAGTVNGVVIAPKTIGWFTLGARPAVLGTEFLDDLASRLVAQGVGAVGVDIFMGRKARIPTGVGPYLGMVATGGTQRLATQNGNVIARPSVQVNVRADTYPSAMTMLDAALVAFGGFVGLHNITINGTFYLSLVPRQDIVDLGLDDVADSRPMLAFNMDAERSLI